MKNFSKAEDFSHRKKSSPNEYEMIAEVLAAGGENKVYRTLDARCSTPDARNTVSGY